MKWIIRTYALILLAYTGWRTWDFMTAQLPAGNISLWLPLLFLFATEAGLALWHETSMNHSSTHQQQQISTALTWLDFVGSLAAGVADMIIRQTLDASYTIPPLLRDLLIYGLPALVAANVAGVLIYLSNDAEQQIDRAKRQLRYEINRQALRELHENRGAIAETMKKQIYSQLRDDVTGKVARQFTAANSQAHGINATQAPSGVAFSSNGRKPQPQAHHAETSSSQEATPNHPNAHE